MQRRPGFPSVTYHETQQEQGHPQGVYPAQMQPYPVMPSMSGVARAARLLSTLVSQTVVLTVLVALAEVNAPEAYRPSTILGRFSGGHEAAELKAKQEATAAFQQQLQLIGAELDRTTRAYDSLFQRANAVTQQAYQMEAMVMQFQEQVASQGMASQTFGANVADLACLAAPFFDAESQDALRQTCGLGKAIRQGQASELAATARDHSAIVPRNVFQNLPDPASMRLEAEQTFGHVWQATAGIGSGPPASPPS